MTQFIDCLIIGGGQAGLAMSRCLVEAGIENVVLERGSLANRWTEARWPSLRLLTPGWMTRLPGQQLAGEADGFLGAADLAERLQGYARTQGLPVIENIDVLALEKLGDRFRAVTSHGSWIARSVVVATGACDRPRIPGWGRKLSAAIQQISSSQYRGVDHLPEGGVLVVGASATGVQLAGEIAASGRQTMLAAGSHVRSPRRYRGRDLFEWLDASGFLADRTPGGRSPAQLIAQPSLQLIGSGDAREVDLFSLARSGVIVAGRAVSAAGSVIGFADDLPEGMARAEQRRQRMLSGIDSFIESAGIDAPEEPQAHKLGGLLIPMAGAIDLREHGISTVLWATGYRRDYSWIHFDACDAQGELRQHGGLCDVPGLFALGLPFMRHRASSFIDGVGRDAEAIAPIIANYLHAHEGLRVA
ncbi:flavin-containing monooxygenase [Aurantiacibacter gilvus]|uniref:NAD(P)/FAD-dependent oxidoreductase n=1 Tax=Aurantiacibacter gilvus TaxID=3139141 RepID=A0ABU9IF25_9SPHN